MHDIDESAKIAVWSGFGIFSMSILLFYRTYQRVKNEKNRIFRSIMLLIMLINTYFYLVNGLATVVEEPFIFEYNTQLAIYLKWFITTPMLIYQVAALEEIPMSNTFMLCSLDAFTITSGFLASQTTTPVVYYPLFIFAGGCTVVVMKSLLSRTFNFYEQKITVRALNNKIFTILVLGITVVWVAYPITALLYRNQIVDLNNSIIIYVILDIFSKGIFGLILIGAKEVEEGIDSTLATLSRSITRVHPITLEPVKEETVEVAVDEEGNKRRAARRASIYVYTPPSSSNTIGGSTNSYASNSNRTLLGGVHVMNTIQDTT